MGGVLAVCQIFCVMLLQGPQSQLQLQILFVGGIDLYQMANYCLYMGDNGGIKLQIVLCPVKATQVFEIIYLV